tara:strand:- start:101 stop:310 length:210 start_codon:yes stop_codon:yes gene_type:complete
MNTIPSLDLLELLITLFEEYLLEDFFLLLLFCEFSFSPEDVYRGDEEHAKITEIILNNNLVRIINVQNL